MSIQDFGAGTPDTPVASALITNISMAIAANPRNPKLRRARCASPPAAPSRARRSTGS